MDSLLLSRWQFAVTSMFHFVFVPLTLGLSILVAWFETRWVKTGDETWKRMARYWGKLFLINFAIGVVTGITLEFQFGMNWAEYSRYVGDIFGAPLAIEATLAFFLESVMIGVWIFGWNKVSPRVHALSICLVAFASNLSALWILLANGWMQHPVGYEIRNGRAEMTDFLAVATNPTGWLEWLHTLGGAYVLAAFFVMGVSAWHLLRKNETAFFTRSFRSAAGFSMLAALLLFGSADLTAVNMARTQPYKLAAVEAQWETLRGAPYNLFSIPVPGEERNRMEIGIPKLLSLLAFHDPNAEVKGLKELAPADRPPIIIPFVAYRVMLAAGGVMLLLLGLGFWYSRRPGLESRRCLLRAMLWAIPLPYLAIQAGWTVTEVGRQPWIVYGVLRTSDAVSKAVSAGQVLASLAAFTLIYSFLGTIDIWLLAKYARKGPESPAAGKEA
jgi:cytochrome d ubiquinol oxidase subunit I